jgi:hypothetical protein
VGYLIVYLGHLQGTPRPVTELPWLLWMSPEQILQTARRDLRLADLRADGAELVVGGLGFPPDEAWLRLTDSQEALGIALGDDLPAFYRSLGTGQ